MLEEQLSVQLASNKRAEAVIAQLSSSLCETCQRTLAKVVAQLQASAVREMFQDQSMEEQVQELKMELSRAHETIDFLQGLHENALEKAPDLAMHENTLEKAPDFASEPVVSAPTNTTTTKEEELERLLAKRELEIKYLEEELRMACSALASQPAKEEPEQLEPQEPIAEGPLQPATVKDNAEVIAAEAARDEGKALEAALACVGSAERNKAEVSRLREAAREAAVEAGRAKSVAWERVRELEERLVSSPLFLSARPLPDVCNSPPACRFQADAREVEARARAEGTVPLSVWSSAFAMRCAVLR